MYYQAVTDLLALLKARGGTIRVVGNNLKINVPNGTIDGALLAKIKEKKKDIIFYLKQSMPLSFEQERLWFLNQLSPGNVAYNSPVILKVSGKVDISLLAQSFKKIALRHEALRTVFKTVDGSCVARLTPSEDVTIHVTNLNECNQAIDEKFIHDWIQDQENYSFDLSNELLFRVSLLVTSNNINYLIINTHHIISDNWSAKIFIQELQLYYSSGLLNVDLPDLEMQYSDYAVSEREKFSDSQKINKGKFWIDYLSNVPDSSILSTDFPRGSDPEYICSNHRFKISAETSLSLLELGKEFKVTPFILFLAAYYVFLFRYTSVSELVVGTTFTNRSAVELEKLIGFFVNTLPVRCDVHARMTYSDVLAELQKSFMSVVENSDVPFGRIVEAMGSDRNIGHNPIFQTMFNLKVADVVNFKLGELNAEAVESRRLGARFDLIFTIEKRNEEWSGEFAYDVSLFKDETVTSMANGFCQILKCIADNPDTRVEEIPVLSEDDFLKQRYAWNNTDHKFNEDMLIHQSFEENVKKVPDAIAVRTTYTAITYNQLNNNANITAHFLRDNLHLPAHSPIAVCLTRKPFLIESLIGISKAGCAYVPIDPDWPILRVMAILNKIKATALITEKALLEKMRELQWCCPSLRDILCLEIDGVTIVSKDFDENLVADTFDHIADSSDTALSAAGFISSYTGQPFSLEEIEQYVWRVSNIAAPYLHADAHVLEIGAGSGLIVKALAPRVAHYTAMDPSQGMLSKAKDSSSQDGLENVSFIKGFAHDLHREKLSGIDLIVASSVVQFFPGLTYLERVIKDCLDLLNEGGVLILADIPDLRRREEFRNTLEEFKLIHSDEARVSNYINSLLYVDEDFFSNYLNGCELDCAVEIKRRDNIFKNELRYRYDVVIRKISALSRISQTKNLKSIHTSSNLPLHAIHDEVSQVSSDSIAYYMHTSGSSGEPKGIAVSHKSVVNLIEWVNKKFSINVDDQLLFVTSVCFDLSVYDIFGVLSAGGSIFIADENDITDPHRIKHILEGHSITFWDSAPAFLNQLMQSASSFTGKSKESLRLVFNSGDWIPLSLPDLVRNEFPNAQFISLGGATEAAIWSNWYSVGQVEKGWRSIPYGYPINNCQYYIFDEYMNFCPVNVPGNLYIGGVCLAKGYTDPLLTTEKFIRSPFEGDERVLYNTGDRAKYWPDGTIEFLGRRDSQVKIRGYRIETAEISKILQQHPAIDQAFVVPQSLSTGEKYLAAYLMFSESSAKILKLDIRQYLNNYLPAYMQPQRIFQIDYIPVTANGKLDLKKLSEIGKDIFTDNYKKDMSVTEKTVMSVWNKILENDDISTDDNFFDVGGNSLLLVRVAQALNGTFSCDVSAMDLLRYTTIRALAKFIDDSIESVT